MTTPLTLRRHPDFNRLWLGLTVSQVGSAVGNVAMPVVAVVVVGASTLEVAVLAGVASVVTVLASLPLGSYVEFRPKRPVMIAADLARFAAGASIPVAAAFGLLSFAQLCLVAARPAGVQRRPQVNLVSREHVVDADGRPQSTTWASVTPGPATDAAPTPVELDGLRGALAVATAFILSRKDDAASPR
ncbi:MAG TPA: hypothetical protein VE172_00910 [Stackebrandtia sp.]|uniref:hypothetical protein n=1 Tax=Stackebrandtia sp. TaxID=2023065 RepID=UPI002D28B8EE|nr:hypothetical protein [Stackebrandtia sp.]HZE37350.1 hypothetical protein [Stackebrandtia sp.]